MRPGAACEPWPHRAAHDARHAALTLSYESAAQTAHPAGRGASTLPDQRSRIRAVRASRRSGSGGADRGARTVRPGREARRSAHERVPLHMESGFAHGRERMGTRQGGFAGASWEEPGRSGHARDRGDIASNPRRRPERAAGPACEGTGAVIRRFHASDCSWGSTPTRSWPSLAGLGTLDAADVAPGADRLAGGGGGADQRPRHDAVRPLVRSPPALVPVGGGQPLRARTAPRRPAPESPPCPMGDGLHQNDLTRRYAGCGPAECRSPRPIPVRRRGRPRGT